MEVIESYTDYFQRTCKLLNQYNQQIELFDRFSSKCFENFNLFLENENLEVRKWLNTTLVFTFIFWLKYFSYHKQIQKPFLNQISTVIPFKTVSE